MTSIENANNFILSILLQDANALRCPPLFVAEIYTWLQQDVCENQQNAFAKLLETSRNKDSKMAILDTLLEPALEDATFVNVLGSYLTQFENYQKKYSKSIDNQVVSSKVENAIIGSTIQANGNIQVGNSIQQVTTIHGNQVQGNHIEKQITLAEKATYVEKIEGNNNTIGNNNSITLQQGSAYFEAAAKKLNFLAPEEPELEKILGSKSHLVKISWLAKGLQAAKSVCRVVLPNGTKGTGFVLKGGFLLTNFHVLPSANAAANAKIEFDFEEDMTGNSKQIVSYSLESATFKSSPITKLDYAYVKIQDNMAQPLSQWGFLETNTFSEPQAGEPINIIQHPNGETKQIALTYNEVIGVFEHRLHYLTDTEKGSSGSPAFDNDWKVIALHHAGKTAAEGGLNIDKQGNKKAANEGILMKYIMADLG
jgi:V8-like Glu-specific endopeptidase